MTAFASIVVPSGGAFPHVAAYAGKLRVAMKTGTQQISLYQSVDGGISWAIVGTPQNSQSDVFDIDSHTDQYGTHIVWATGPFGIFEVYYVRYDDQQNSWGVPFNVTNLSAQQSGFRPKVTTSTNEAHVTFAVLEGPPFNSHRVYTRDLSLSPGGTWESVYAIAPPTEAEPVSSLNTVAIGDSIYALIAEEKAGTASNTHATQFWWFTRRHKNDLTWRPLYNVTVTSVGLENEPMRTRMVVGNDNAVYFTINCNFYATNPTCADPHVKLWRYQQAAPNFTTDTLWSSLNHDDFTSGPSLLLSGWRNGVYAYWTGSPNPYNMRRKPLAITGTIAETTLLTGNNWISGTLSIGPNVSIRLKPGSVTRVLSGAQITVNSGVSFIVEPGAALIFESGTQMSFAPGTGINCAGTMAVSGPVTFTSTSPSTQWNGILLTGAASQVDGAVINNALIGINADQNAGHAITNCTIDGGNYGVFLYSGNSPGAQLSTTVANNTITHSSVAGIFVDNTSKPIIQNNLLQGLLAPIVGNYGIVFMFSSPQNVVSNKISGYGNAGIYCYKSSPALVDEADAGYNCSFDNTGTGVLAENKAFPVLGILDEHLPGKNTFASNQNFQITLIDNCEVFSEENFYREPEPIPSLDFSVDASSTLHYDPSLSTDPNACAGGSSLMGLGGDKREGDDPPSTTPIGALMRQVVKLHIRGQHAAAMAILKNVAADPQSSVDVKMWAVHEMIANYQLMARQSGVNRLSAYLGALRLSQSNNEVRRAICDVLPRSLHREGDYASTIAALDDNVRQFPNTSSKLVALFAKVSLAVNELHDATMAQNAFQAMQAASRTSRLTKLAEKLLESSPSSSSNSLAMGGELSPLGAPRPSAFTLEQNYPNPFNPTTVIRYALPNDGIISLKVFDILGREVATLESGFKLAGTYESMFDASGLASGMYIYRLSAGATTLSRKMIIMK